MQLVVNQLLTNYSKTGRGRVVLLLHGWGDDCRTFNDLTKELSKKYTVVSLDLPGFGQTQAPQEIWNLDNYARFVGDFLAKLELSPYAIVGHSNGGALSIRAVAQVILKPHKLVLLASSGIRDRQNLRRLGLKAVAKTGKAATFWQ